MIYPAMQNIPPYMIYLRKYYDFEKNALLYVAIGIIIILLLMMMALKSYLPSK